MVHPIPRAAGAIIAFTAGLAFACGAVAQGIQLQPDQGSSRRFCTQQYDPVCASRGGERRTFGNACEADRAGYGVVYRGECRAGSNGRVPSRSDRFCTREYAPVCGLRGRDRQTFGNACEARVAGYRIVRRGGC